MRFQSSFMLITVQRSLIIELLAKGANFGIRQSSRRTVPVFSLCVVVKHQHHHPRTVAGGGIPAFAGRQSNAEGRAPPADS